MADKPKPDWSLLPLDALTPAVALMSGLGLAKHRRGDWREKPVEYHWACLMRHLVAWQSGQRVDPESGHSHLAHAVCRLIFLIELERAEARPNE